MGRSALLRATLATAGLSTILCATPAHAALELAASMQAIESSSVVTVVLVPPMAVFQLPLTPTGLQKNGCSYTTSDRGAIRTMVAVLQAADVTVNPVYQKTDVREGVYLTLADGSKFSLLIADNSGGRLPVLGIAEATNGGQIQSASVSARPALSRDVRDWAKRFGGAGAGTSCDLQTDIAEDPAPPQLPR